MPTEETWSDYMNYFRQNLVDNFAKSKDEAAYEWYENAWSDPVELVYKSYPPEPAPTDLDKVLNLLACGLADTAYFNRSTVAIRLDSEGNIWYSKGDGTYAERIKRTELYSYGWSLEKPKTKYNYEDYVRQAAKGIWGKPSAYSAEYEAAW